MTPLETLKAARDLISDPARWTQGKAARTYNLSPTYATASDAVCWCSLGAIYKPFKYGEMFDADFALSHLDRVCWRLHEQSVANFNDTHTHAEVIALFDAAIAELEAT